VNSQKTCQGERSRRLPLWCRRYYAMLAEKDAAFAAQDQAAAAGSHLDTIKLDPALDNLPSDSRYADLLRRIGLPQ
jgi:hypothetical protein